MKSVSLQITENIESALKQIKQGNHVPWLPQGSPQTFSVTPQLVTRALDDLAQKQFPAIVLATPRKRYRHLLSDILSCTLEAYITGLELDFKREAIDKLAFLSSDVLSTITLNPTWGGLALRTRVVHNEENTEIEEASAAFSYSMEVDYIERQVGAQSKAFQLSELPVGTQAVLLPGQSQTEQIINAFYNAMLTATEIAWVEYAPYWPMPMEQIPSTKTPGIWFREQDEEYRYTASQQADKRLKIALMHIAVSNGPLDQFHRTVDRGIARIKDVLGRNADLNDRVLTIDIQSLRATRSEWPVAVIDADLQLRYVSNFMQA